MRTKDRVMCLDCGIPVERVHWQWCRSCYKRRHPPTIWPDKQCARNGCSKTFTPSGTTAGMQRYCGPVMVDGVLRHACRDTADRVRKRAARKASGPAEPRASCVECGKRRVCRFDSYGEISESVGEYWSKRGSLCGYDCFKSYCDSGQGPGVAGLFSQAEHDDEWTDEDEAEFSGKPAFTGWRALLASFEQQD
jgi:hypothetical protein